MDCLRIHGQARFGNNKPTESWSPDLNIAFKVTNTKAHRMSQRQVAGPRENQFLCPHVTEFCGWAPPVWKDSEVPRDLRLSKAPKLRNVYRLLPFAPFTPARSTLFSKHVTRVIESFRIPYMFLHTAMGACIYAIRRYIVYKVYHMDPHIYQKMSNCVCMFIYIYIYTFIGIYI